MEEKTEVMDELEQLRADYDVLKNKFDSQQIVNDRLLRSAMKSKARSINNEALWEYFACAFVMISSPWTFHYVLETSWWFVGVTEVMMLICAIATSRMHSHLKPNDASGDLLSFAKGAKVLKQGYLDWLKWGILMLVFWISWLITEIIVNSRGDDAFVTGALITSLLVGVVIGGCIGLHMHRKVVRSCDEIIDQIEN